MKKRKLAGWIAVGLSTLITAFWAFWGITKNFHEGWYYESLLSNLGLMFLQYLSPFLILLGITLVSIVKPRFGSGLHGVIGVLAILFFHAFSNTATLMIILPVFGLGMLYWFGRPQPKKVAYLISIGLPLLTLIISGIEPGIRVSRRIKNINLNAVEVSGSNVTLVWAPNGPGWPRNGVTWEESMKTCRYLSMDGHALADSPQFIWRLPTVDEAVLSMCRHGENCEGVWNAQSETARYEVKPDKESPLWNVRSQIIYWWTATEVDEEHAFMIAYDGRVWQRSKQTTLPNLGFRCVKLPKQ